MAITVGVGKYSGEKLLLVESGFPDLFFITISLGIARFFYAHS